MSLSPVFIGLVALAGLAAAAPVVAMAAATTSSAAPLVETLPGEDPMVVARFVEHMRNNMYLGKYPDGTPMTLETPAERAKPILLVDLAQIIYERGTLSGFTEVCGNDWQTLSFDPLMVELRARGDLSPRQLGFAALLHGAAMEQARNLLPEDCTPGFKASLSASLALSKSISQKYAKAN